MIVCITGNVTFIRDPSKISVEKNTHHTYSPIDMAVEEGLIKQGAGKWPLYKYAKPFNCTIHAVSYLVCVYAYTYYICYIG